MDYRDNMDSTDNMYIYNIRVSIYGESPKWMVYNGKSRNITDDLGVPP